jgi:hypothetical protein
MGRTETRRLARVEDRTALVAVGVAAGLISASGGARPTGIALIDLCLVAGVVGATAVLSARSPWWVPLVAAAFAALIGIHVLVVLVAVVACAIGLYLAGQRLDGPMVNVVVTGAALVAISRSGLGVFLGLSTLVAVGVVLLIAGSAWGAISQFGRRRLVAGVGGLLGLALLSLAGLAAAGAAVRDDATAAVDDARLGVDLLGDGEYDAAADAFDRAAVGFGAVDDGLSSPLAVPARLVPVVSQNVRAGSTLASAAAGTLGEAASALRDVDPSRLRVENGALDIDAVRSVQAPLERVRDSLSALEGAVGDVRSPWLLNRLDTELDELLVDVDDQRPNLDTAIDAVRLAPQMLGGDGERRYLVLFTTPAEVRGLGGFIGNYAEVVLDNGRIDVAIAGRRSDLEERLGAADFNCEVCSEEFLARYGRYGMTAGPGGTAAARTWSNLTMGAFYPDVAEAAASMYVASGGSAVDGVFVMDPHSVEAVMKLGGAVDIPELGVTVSPDGAAEYILRDQYEFATDSNGVRIDALDVLAAQVFLQLQTATLPEPSQLADDFGPLVEERRLLGWSIDAEERALLDNVGLLGTLPELGPDGGFSVSLTNAGASKIDVFLDRQVSVEIVDKDDGGRTLVAEVSLRNDAPTEGLPNFVISNSLGLPNGTSRLFVTFYGPSTLDLVTMDGEPVATEPGTEAGWSTYSLFVTLPSGATSTFVLEFSLDGTANTGPQQPVLFEQPLADRIES